MSALSRTRTRTRPGARAVARRRRLAGVAYLLVPVLLAWLCLAVYNKEFTDRATVVVETGQAGNEMHERAEVKVRGVVVGEVTGVDSDGERARLTLALHPDQLDRVPSDVRAQLLPTSLFGQRYVALVPPPHPSPKPLARDSVIPQDRSRNAVELQDALDRLLPLLTAVQPQKLSATLTAVAQALRGRGAALGRSMVELDAYLGRLNPQLPTLTRDIERFAEASRTYAKAAPGIVEALHDATTTSATLAAKKADLSRLYASVTTGSRDLDGWLRQNRRNLIRLTATSRPTLELFRRYAPSFPCTLSTLADFVPAMDRALGKGTRRPGLQVGVRVVEPRGRYRPGRDAPAYGAGGGPRCYPVPWTGDGTPARPADGGSGTSGGASGRGAPRGGGPVASLHDGLGPANSPGENELLNELLAASGAAQPGALPDWSSVLGGPAFRGTEVKLK
ncbi:MCE family protein [Streptomyces boncukensis]|uniref:MCE family protein n=1 Tax=Streptomyces boncukensis TaxID=2711219 RepID=A0A6G4X2T7_9ACTN|nr:MCE family protein [Streptomyces boncukensis]NGO71200.1 MCE family protein [Streptomyces boncukensis]